MLSNAFTLTNGPYCKVLLTLY